MKTNYEIRYAAHPEDAKNYDTKRLRRDFLIEKVFSDDEVNLVYSMYDRMIVGGAKPVKEELKLEAIDPLKAPYFTTRREVGILVVATATWCLSVLTQKSLLSSTSTQPLLTRNTQPRR